MLFKWLTHDVFHPPAWIERRVRVLKNHLDTTAQCCTLWRLVDGVGILIVKGQAAARGLIQTHQQTRHSAFSATGFTHQCQCLALFNFEADAVHRMQQLPRFALHHPVEPGR